MLLKVIPRSSLFSMSQNRVNLQDQEAVAIVSVHLEPTQFYFVLSNVRSPNFANTGIYASSKRASRHHRASYLWQ